MAKTSDQKYFKTLLLFHFIRRRHQNLGPIFGSVDSKQSSEQEREERNKQSNKQTNKQTNKQNKRLNEYLSSSLFDRMEKSLRYFSHIYRFDPPCFFTASQKLF